MKIGRFVTLVLVMASASTAAQTITDGDTLKQGGVIYRLWGIDSPELAQICADGWPAGRMAATRLQALTAGKSIVCQERDRDRYALNRLCATGYDGADCGPRIMSADRFGDRIFLKTCGHPLRVEPWKPLSASRFGGMTSRARTR